MRDSLASGYRAVNSHGRIAVDSSRLFNIGMETIDEIRLRNLETLIVECGSQAAFAERVEVAASQVSQWRTRAPHASTGRPRVMSTDMARQIERKLGRERGWMDHDHTIASPQGLTQEQRAHLEAIARMSPAVRKAFLAARDAFLEPGRPASPSHRKRA